MYNTLLSRASNFTENIKQTLHFFILNTESAVKHRIKELISFLGINQTELARQCDIDQAHLSQAGSVRRPTISTALVSKITKRYPSIDPWWLLTGEGEMLYYEKTGRKKMETFEEPEVEYLTKNDWPIILKQQLEEYDQRISNLESGLKARDAIIKQMMDKMGLLPNGSNDEPEEVEK